MNTVNRQGFRAARTVALAIVGAFAFYIATVGSIPATGRHMEDGRLQWMRGSVASTALEIYAWPARYLAVVPVVGSLFELSAEFWCVSSEVYE